VQEIEKCLCDKKVMSLPKTRGEAIYPEEIYQALKNE